MIFACLYPGPHLEKWGYTKFFFARSARESCFVYPHLKIRGAAPDEDPLTRITNKRHDLQSQRSKVARSRDMRLTGVGHTVSRERKVSEIPKLAGRLPIHA